MALHNVRGHAGESLAVAYLELRGCRILERNARIGGVEVDALVKDGPDTVLVEVKLRSRADYGGAAGALDAVKRGRLLRAAATLLGRGHERVRIDVVTIDLGDESAEVRHYRSAIVT